MDSLLNRLKKYKYEEDVTYKTVAAELNIPYTTFYTFTGGTRNLKPKYSNLLNQYLKERGY